MPIAVDIETVDPHIKTLGDGAIRRDGRILGVGIYDGEKAHYFTDMKNRQLREMLADSSTTKVFHNGVYDLNWLCNGEDAFTVGGCLEDTMTRQGLLDAYQSRYDLDSCCQLMKVPGKNKGDTIDKHWTGKGKAIEHLADIDPKIVGAYCVQDCKATYLLYNAQQKALEEQNLTHANKVESDMYPIIMDAKKNGIRVDEAARKELSKKLSYEYECGMDVLERKYPFFDSLQAPTQLQKIWEIEKIPFVYTPLCRPSFAADVLLDTDHEVAQEIVRLRTLNTTLTRFVEGNLVDFNYNGRIHPTYLPALRDDGGTITGRMSCRFPNMQQFSSREDKFGKEVRSILLPDEDCYLGAFDYKQIEYVVFTHYSTGKGSEEARKSIIDGMDYHSMAMKMMGWEGKDGRTLAKRMNFGSIYGLGAASFAKMYRRDLMKEAQANNMTVEEYAFYKMDEYFTRLTFVRPTINLIRDIAVKRGYVKTINNRRQRVPLDGKVYKVVNYLVQGTAADILKNALVAAWNAGVFNVLKIHGFIHDEVLFSIPKTRAGAEASQELKHIMEETTPLEVPTRVDTEIGNDWGHCNLETWDKFRSEV